LRILKKREKFLFSFFSVKLRFPLPCGRFSLLRVREKVFSFGRLVILYGPLSFLLPPEKRDPLMSRVSLFSFCQIPGAARTLSLQRTWRSSASISFSLLLLIVSKFLSSSFGPLFYKNMAKRSLLSSYRKYAVLSLSFPYEDLFRPDYVIPLVKEKVLSPQ